MEKFLIIDTETTNGFDNPLCYDVGFAVVDVLGRIYEQKSFVVADIFLNENLMKEAFFADKIPQYWEEIKNGTRVLRRFTNIMFTVRKIMRKWNIKIVIAHNMRFDYNSLHTTLRYLTKSKFRFFFPYGTKFWCTLKMSREIFANNEKYNAFCSENEYKVNGRNRLTAEIIYRYLIHDNNFVENHTGLEDVLIEKEIFVYCVRKNYQIDGSLWA